MTDKPLVLLFDIDGTLLDSSGAGGSALLDALIKVFELESAEQVPLHGRTDLGIMSELLEKYGIEASTENLNRLCDKYYELLPAVLEGRSGACLPGVRELLDELAAQDNIHLALLTGNMPTSAKMKLEYFGLWPYFSFGIFGDLAAQRPLLAEPALKMISEETGVLANCSNTLILGDTPLDIELADCMQVQSLAVCTGGFSEQELVDAGASLVLHDLSDTKRICAWMNNMSIVNHG
ncbi:MAG: HAD hydrolase-like protein [Planctomycetota bacterium]